MAVSKAFCEIQQKQFAIRKPLFERTWGLRNIKKYVNVNLRSMVSFSWEGI